VNQYLLQPGLPSLRDVPRLLLLSGLFTGIAILAFPRNAPTRRLLLITAVTVLMVLAWLLASLDAVWYVAMETLPGITLGQALPIGLAWLWIGVALFLTGRHLAHVRQALVDVARLPLIDDARLTQEAAGLARSMGVGIPSLRLGRARQCRAWHRLCANL
jgi:hypothetical protein